MALSDAKNTGCVVSKTVQISPSDSQQSQLHRFVTLVRLSGAKEFYEVSS
jgi:hypothetical protein